MNNVNKTLYIPLYGKAFVSRKGIILHDPKAEMIWQKEGFALKGKSSSKWLAYYMGMRSAVFDRWLKAQMSQDEDAVILHIGCGMDSRVERVGTKGHQWYDIDFPDVINERQKYYHEDDFYHMAACDVRNDGWIQTLPSGRRAIIVMEGVSMYFQREELQSLLSTFSSYFSSVKILMDCYTEKAAKISKYKNPINDVGVTVVYGVDDPAVLATDTGIAFFKEHDMTPEFIMNELHGMEKVIFRNIFGGKFSRGMYRMFEYRSI